MRGTGCSCCAYQRPASPPRLPRHARRRGDLEMLDHASSRTTLLLAGGTVLALVGVPLELALEALGGLLTAAGGGMALVGVAFGMPT